MAKKRQKRRSFSREFKERVVQEMEQGKRVVDAAEEYGIHATLLSQWKSKYGSGGGSGRGPRRRGRKPAQAPNAGNAPAASQSTAGRPQKSTTGRRESADIAELERMIGRLTVENAMLRRELEEGRS